jgi:hypothetical protein
MSSSADQIAALAALYSQPSFDLCQALPDIADRIHGQLHELLRKPTPDRAERLSLELEGTRRHVLRIREALIRESTPQGAAL